MDLEKVEQYFYEHGEFIYRTSRFHLENLPDSCGDTAEVNFTFQNAFLNMLKSSITDEQAEKFQSETVPRQLTERIGKGMRLCEVTEQYFETLLYDGACGTIPAEIREHILDCKKCSEKFFKYMLGSVTPLNERQEFYIKNIIKQLVKHFSLLGEKVSCSNVKSFLPLLLDKRLKIRVPTPVTVHIDNCSQCHKGLGSLAKLDLEPDQLIRLSNLYSRSSKTDTIQCKDAWGSIDLAAEFRFDNVPVKVLEHIYLCKSCRELLFDKRRLATRQNLRSDNSESYPCEAVNPSDLFDLAFPFGLDSSKEKTQIYRGPFISHVRNCPRCLEKLADMSRIFYSIDEYKDSGILTCYELKEQKPNLDISYGRDIFDQQQPADFANWPQGAEIGCEQVKRFLPQLCDTDTKIKVPAAVIAHIEQCSKCKEDLQTIRSWNLGYKKNARLSEFLSQQTFEKSPQCDRVKQDRAKIVESFATMRFEDIDAELLNHICLCRACRDMIYKARMKMPVHTNHVTEKDDIFCENIKEADLFDYVLAYGLDPAEDGYMKFRESLVRHLRNCPKCLEKIRQLYNNIYAIAERGRLGVPDGFEHDKKSFIGHWHAAQARKIAENIDELDDEQFETLLAHLSMAGEDPYKNWDIKVKICSCEQENPSEIEQEVAETAEAKDICEIAIEYMYDMIYPAAEDMVPEQVSRHIESCSYCSNQLAAIREFLTEQLNFRSQHKAVARARVGACIKEHFEFIDQDVDCRSLKEFLPLLSDPKLSVDIPTPITVHLDQCSQCAKDVAILRSLGLKSRQLDTIAEFFAEALSSRIQKYELYEVVGISKIEDFTEAFARMQFDKLSPDIIRQLCLSPACRADIYQKRGALISEIDDTKVHDQLSCESIKTSDLLAYCLPRYFDLTKNWYEQVDKTVSNHLSHCKSCLQKLQLLHRAIFNIADRENSAIVTCYELAPVRWNKDNPNAAINCKVLRPHLAGFADEPLGLMVPSALAAHLMDCRQCMDDYTRIDSLGLNSGQLKRLGRILSNNAENTKISCPKARKAIGDYLEFRFDKISPEILEHIQVCPDCRCEIIKQRQLMIDKLPAEITDDDFNCRFVRDRDLFNCCFPPTDSANRVYPVLTSHLTVCRRCLKELQKLQETVCEIADKADSGILTENNVPIPEKERQGFLPLDYQYPQWPIRVWTNDKAEAEVQKAAEAEYEDYLKTKEAGRISVFTEKLKQRAASASNLRTVKRTAAAAVIPIAVGLFLYLLFSMSPSVAMARTYSEVVSSVRKMVNVCIKKYTPGQSEPVRVEWISRSSNVIVQITNKQILLFDLRNKVRMIKNLQTGTIQSDTMSENLFNKAESLIEGALDIVPFEDLSDVPSSEWNQVDNKETNAGEVYDLTWRKSIGKGITEYHKRRYFFSDDRTHVPNKVEVYTKDSSEDNYTLWEYREIITYSDEKDITHIIKSAFGNEILEMKPSIIHGQSEPNGSTSK